MHFLSDESRPYTQRGVTVILCHVAEGFSSAGLNMVGRGVSVTYVETQSAGEGAG